MSYWIMAMFGRKTTRSLFFLVPSCVSTLMLIAVIIRNRLSFVSRSQQLNLNDEGSRQSSASTGFLLDTPYCKIQDLNPFDSVAMRFVRRRGEILCLSRKSITYVKGPFLRLNRTKIRKYFYDKFRYCRYQPIRRGDNQSDFYFEYGEVSKPFHHDILISPRDEFMRVDCYNHSGGKITINFHAVVTKKKDVERRCDYNFKQHLKKNSFKETYNVQMVGVDSTSRLNFIRQMPQTREFLQKELSAFEMSGYNKVADNTFVNIVPLMVGKFVEELGWNETMSKQPFDDYPFLWKNFSKAGYRTLYAEDAPWMAIFSYLKEGFHAAPADYYNRPLALAMEEDENVWSNSHHCVVDRMETAMLLDYATDFSRVFRNKPHFGFTFITRLTHDSLDVTGSADYAYIKFLKRFKEEGHLNNTVLVFYSDHGFRFGSLRATYIGKVEERLPFLYFVFPPSFHTKYPQLVKNLRTNARRLTTPFDVHETLKELLYFDGVERKVDITNRGISLFREIPEKRTCEHAGILPHWCLCMEQKKLDTSSKIAVNISKAVVNLINMQLSSVSHLCASLTLYNIHDVVQIESNEKVLKFSQSLNDVINRTVIFGKKAEAPVIYQVTLSTLPGQGQFEVTVIHEVVQDSYKLGGDISRLNSYNSQSICVNDSRLKKFCYCQN